MNKRFWIFSTLVLAILLSVFLLRPREKHAEQPQDLESSRSNAIRSRQPVGSPVVATSAVASASEQPKRDASASTNRKSSELGANLIERAIAERNVSVKFYGKVVDQSDQPVPSARIVMSVRHGGLSPSASVMVTFPKKETLTDSEGRFMWTEGSGDVLNIETIARDGYRLSPQAVRNYGPSTGSPDNPVIIKMWKEGTKEPLVSGSKVCGMDSGKTYTLDLVSGKKTEGQAEGDLRVSITRPSGVKSRDKYQWSFIIEGIGGGVLLSDDEFMYTAPDSGYEPKLEMQLDPADPAWAPIVKKRFFIRTRNGQVYGRIGVEVYAIYNVHSAMNIEYTVNPAGSRNLQP